MEPFCSRSVLPLSSSLCATTPTNGGAQPWSRSRLGTAHRALGSYTSRPELHSGEAKPSLLRSWPGREQARSPRFTSERP
ncbi:formin-like protein 6 [Iris pallida]|uniref:Formin-like protein 6 n=1 Tax=Iris pallida TaxID=29817 RepID=A0AAX6ENZ0_IRIPA|nr:formin-like protein 6 [Iris pallida]KAJ6808601.1 formin-like protein 6 [Iris pallida]